MAGIKLCVRNLPCKVLEAELTAAMVEVCLAAWRYNVQIPKRRARGKSNNYGYGFVICRQDSDAMAFIQAFHGFRFENIQSGKSLSVELAHRSQLSTTFSVWLSESSTTVDAERVVTPSSYDALSVVANSAETRFHTGQDSTFWALNEAPAEDVFGIWTAIPDAHELPSTRLEADEGNPVRLATHQEQNVSRMAVSFQ
eukprot:TRINITY_DN4123_c0_g1_i2.p1 TRINITY_DN4123_c0_g1~~TRINITY_DN4123_c0_g1_i2.p1  ORF type:complete len:224 (-),score=21.18 TRINITY_DN4123_c0_g1_i2:298-891(-)